MNIRLKMHVVTAALAFIAAILQPLLVHAGGYYITDKDGKVISEIPEKIIAVGPTEKTVVFNDHSDMAVFAVQWDADEKTLIIRGDNVHLKIYGSGKIEKWSSFEESEQGQYPIYIEQTIPVRPQH